MTQTDIFHYPPELFELLIETIPLLNRSKKSVILFFRGAGVPEKLLKDISDKIETDKDSINKFEIARTILTRVNEKTDTYIRERRELLKRIVEFESFTNCWESDQYKAKGLVAEIRNIVNVKDTFTRMKHEKENEQAKHTAEYNKKVEKIKERAELIEKNKKEFYSLFGISNPHERGKKLESVLNSLFSIFGILVREAFTLKGDNGEGIIEQIDGVIEIDNQIYLVEMKWKKDKIGGEDIFAHLGRIYHRTGAQGIFISASGFSDSGIIASKEALINKAILVLTDLEEFINVLDNDKDLLQYLKTKIRKAIIDKDPYTKP
ncbi:restriction endonuclease [Phnomibacter sp. MR]|uniref:restriction endonuclease n=1 Tax=Phnomibacter sp. MR TaxID=3042318 RepID=UPI003A804F56